MQPDTHTALQTAKNILVRGYISALEARIAALVQYAAVLATSIAARQADLASGKGGKAPKAHTPCIDFAAIEQLVERKKAAVDTARDELVAFEDKHNAALMGRPSGL